MIGYGSSVALALVWLVAAAVSVRAQEALVAAPRAKTQRPSAGSLGDSPPFGTAPARRPTASLPVPGNAAGEPTGAPAGGPVHRGHAPAIGWPSADGRRSVSSSGAATMVVIPAHRRRPRRIRDFSWIYIDPPEPREIKVHDIVTIIVDEKAEVTVNSRFDRRRNANLNAELNEFVRLGETGNLENAATNSPTIDAALQSRLNSTGKMVDQEGIRYRIAATVVDVRPNGNLVLEARKMIRTNRDVWEYRLTGEVRSEDVNLDNTVMSENIANLNIEKQMKGKIYNSTKRPWGVILYDLLSPF